MADDPTADPTRSDPDRYDPNALPVLRLDPSNLRGLAHPLRLRVLGLLRRDGPSTATRLAAVLGESSGSLSYHLRQLEAHGMITEDERPDAGRERWWRPVHRATNFDDTHASADEKLIGNEFLRAVGRVYADRFIRYADRLDTLEETVGPEYAAVSTMSDWILRLRPDRAATFKREVEQLVERYRATPDTGDDVRAVSALFALLPGDPS